MRRMIIDCDTGTDDAVAVMALLLAKDIDVIAITTVHGNIPAINSADNNLQIVDFLKKDVPVYVGCDRPIDVYKRQILSRERLSFRPLHADVKVRALST